MSLQNRLARIEADLADLKQQLSALLTVIEAEDDQTGDTSTLTLDGERMGGERDQTQSLG